MAALETLSTARPRLFRSHRAPPASPAPADAAVAALLSLPAAVSNWGGATAAVPGAAWVAGSEPCGTTPAGADPDVPPLPADRWKGVRCDAGSVVEVSLPGLGLSGTLPAGLSDQPTLLILNLSSNSFRGSLPPEWMTPGGTLRLSVADLSSNLLTGGWAGDTAAGHRSTQQLQAGRPAGRQRASSWHVTARPRSQSASSHKISPHPCRHAAQCAGAAG